MKEIEIPKGYEARIEGNKVIIESIKDKDERIRKALLRCCDDWEKGQFGCMKSEDVPAIRAYLEKQKDICGERVKNIIANMLEDGIEGIQRELIEFLSNTVNASWVDIIQSADAYAERIRNIIEKQKKQMPELEKANDLRTWLNIVSKVLTEFQGIGQYLDNPICQEIANMLREKYCFDDASSDWDRVYRKGLDAGKIYGYNKAKKEQKPAEWSDKDEKMLKETLALIETIEDINKAKDGFLDVKMWLKSIRENMAQIHPYQASLEAQCEADGNIECLK